MVSRNAHLLGGMEAPTCLVGRRRALAGVRGSPPPGSYLPGALGILFQAHVSTGLNFHICEMAVRKDTASKARGGDEIHYAEPICKLQIATCWFGFSVPWLWSALLDDWEATSSLVCSRTVVTGWRVEPYCPVTGPCHPDCFQRPRLLLSLPSARRGNRGSEGHSYSSTGLALELHLNSVVPRVRTQAPARLCATLPASRPRGWGHCTCVWH